MAKIIYAVAGEGFGHSSRSHLIGQRLIDSGHDVAFVGSRKSLAYLSEYFSDRVKEIFGLSFEYKDGQVHPLKTIKKNLLAFRSGNRTNRRLFKDFFERFKPDLIISDFEPFSAWWAWRNKVPFFSIDHEHVLTHCRLEHPPGHRLARLNAYFVTRCYYAQATSYIVTNFFKVPVRKESVVVAPPVIRPEVTTVSPSAGAHIVVYTTTGRNQENLVMLLNKFSPQQFFIYGFDKSEEDKNCTLKKRSTEGFVADVASAKGVVASAGFSLISESMYLKKKMCLLPIPGQYEQVINAHYVQKLGLGISAETLDETTLSRFLEIIDEPAPDDDQILWPDNEKFFTVLQTALTKLGRPIEIEITG